MFSRLRALLRVTAVRLSIIYTIIFGILAVGIVAYMTGATVNVLRNQFEESINEEIVGLARIYRQRGLSYLINTLDRRSKRPGANLYVVTDPSGEIIAGNVPRLQRGVMRRNGWTGRPFRYYRHGDSPREDNRAIARVVEVPNGVRILVGRDIGEHEDFRRIVSRAFKLALGTMVALGILTWFFVGRRALKRIDQVSKSSVRILGGDRSERLPVSGTGDEFDRLSENLNHMLDRINRLDDGLKQMSDNIAHDLKTPITRLRNKADNAMRLNDDAESQQLALEDIISDCDQIVKTFDALLMISRVESGSKVVEMGTVNLFDLVTDVHELYEAAAEDAGAELLMNCDGEPIQVRGNRELLSQAVSNLIDNALKYAVPETPDAKITLEVLRRPEGPAIIVADNGMGISEGDRDKVTERFVRLDKSRNKQGNGLGLSLVKAIAKLHGGGLALEDNSPGLRTVILMEQQSEGGINA
ncbi:MAG: HAMP domain-containing sensor histidine kinase [Pseudomonadota bacterium]